MYPTVDSVIPLKFSIKNFEKKGSINVYCNKPIPPAIAVNTILHSPSNEKNVTLVDIFFFASSEVSIEAGKHTYVKRQDIKKHPVQK